MAAIGRPRRSILARDARVLRSWVRGTTSAIGVSLAQLAKNFGAAASDFLNVPSSRGVKWISNAMLNGRDMHFKTAIELFYRVSVAVLTVDPRGVKRKRARSLPFGLFRRLMRLYGDDLGPDTTIGTLTLSREDIPKVAGSLARVAVAPKEGRECADRVRRLTDRFKDYLVRNSTQPRRSDLRRVVDRGIVITHGKRRRRILTSRV